MAPLQRNMILSSKRSKTVTVLSCVVHNTLACPGILRCDSCELWRKYLHALSSLLGNTRKTTYIVSMAPADDSSSPRKQCTDCANSARRLPRNAGRALIWIYRHTLSPLVGYNCRHLPTCSVYGDEAIERFGLWGGGWMTLARILRCQPWGTSGIDNVPLITPAGARWYLPWRYGRWRGVNG